MCVWDHYCFVFLLGSSERQCTVCRWAIPPFCMKLWQHYNSVPDMLNCPVHCQFLVSYRSCGDL